MQEVTAVGATHVGLLRSENQDCLYGAGWATQRSGARLAITAEVGDAIAVLDGMGGHRGGALASWTGAAALSLGRFDATSTPQDVGSVIQDVSDAIRSQGAITSGHQSMGSTIAGVVVTPDGLVLFNVGDSSILRIRDGYVGQLAAIDRVGDATRSNVVGQCLGGSPHPTRIDAHEEAFRPSGDERLLLCTDGLTDCVPNDQIAALADPGTPAQQACTALIAAALRHGAPDNVTLVIIDMSLPEPA